MTMLRLALGWTALGTLLSATAFAQDAAAPDLRQPTSVRRAAFEYDNYLSFAPDKAASASPSDQNAPPAPGKTDAAADTKKDEAKADDEKKDDAGDDKAKEPKRLIGELDHTGINIYGWLEGGVTGNADNPASHFNGPLAVNDRDEFEFNQVYMVAEKTLKLDEKCWDIGGRVDVLYGTDYIYCQSLGWEKNPNGTPKWNANEYGLAIPQAYVEVGHGQLSAKIGHFYTIIGYESMMPTGNFFYSHNYAVRYSEPTAHWGGLFTWKNSDELSLYFGGVNGADRLDGTSDTFSALLGFAYTPKDSEFAVNGAMMTGGQGPGTPGPQGPQTYLDTYVTWTPKDSKWQTVTQLDAGWLSPVGAEADMYSFTQYAFYTINDCWKAGLRYDYFMDENGQYLGGLRAGNPLPLPSGNAGPVQAITAGLNWQPNTNVRIRPELRWDWYNGTGAPLFDDRTLNRQFTAAIDFIVQY